MASKFWIFNPISYYKDVKKYMLYFVAVFQNSLPALKIYSLCYVYYTIFSTDSEFWNTALVNNQFEIYFKIRAASAQSMTIHNHAYCRRLDCLERVEVSNWSQIEIIVRSCQFVFFAATSVIVCIFVHNERVDAILQIHSNVYGK